MNYKSELKSLLKDVEFLRQKLHNLIELKDANLLDVEVIAASQMLDAAIVKYNEIILKKIAS